MNSINSEQVWREPLVKTILLLLIKVTAWLLIIIATSFVKETTGSAIAGVLYLLLVGLFMLWVFHYIMFELQISIFEDNEAEPEWKYKANLLIMFVCAVGVASQIPTMVTELLKAIYGFYGA